MAKCKAKTTRGTRCSREASAGSGFCHQHQTKASPGKAAASSRHGKIFGAAAATATAIAAVALGVDALRKRKTGKKRKKNKRGRARGKK